MKALLLVDIQNDFLPGGALSVKDGDQIIPVIQKLIENNEFDLVIATKDWHPHDHLSFAANHPGKRPGNFVTLEQTKQILWPTHCVEDTYGAEFAPGWDISKVDKIFHKGTHKQVDSYSAFYDNCHQRSTGLGEYLKEQKVTDLYIAGLATDFCVKYSAFDALKLGFNVYIVTDACKAADLCVGDCQRALDDMQAQGAHIIHS